MGRAATVLVVVPWAIALALILNHRMFVSHDTVSNYGHVWYVADRLWHAHRLPFAMPVLGHGHALAFPYAFVPWLTAAALWPLFGEWAVTLCLVVGVVGAAVTTFFAFPELRRGWWAAAVLVNPALVMAAFIGQLPFLWASSFLPAAIGCWRRGRRGWATALAAVAQITHPAVALPIAAAIVALRAPCESPPDRRSLLGRYAVSVAAAVPASVLVYASPVFRDSSVGVKAWAFAATVSVRAALFIVPFGLRWAQQARAVWVAPLLFVALLVPNGFVDTLDIHFGLRSLVDPPNTDMLSFIRSPAFVPGATYRVLRAYDGKLGMYELIQHGARLDSEFFPESIVRRSWPDAATYARFLAHRDVDYVLAFDNYTRRYGTNEIALLGRLAPCVRPVAATKDYSLYHVDRSC